MNASHPCVLVIDDESLHRRFVANVSEKIGVECIEAGTPKDISAGLDCWPDVIVLDMTMPDMDGIEVLRELARRESRAGIIITSGFDGRVVSGACIYAQRLGLNLLGRLDKPIEHSALAELIRSALRNCMLPPD